MVEAKIKIEDAFKLWSLIEENEQIKNIYYDWLDKKNLPRWLRHHPHYLTEKALNNIEKVINETINKRE